MNITSKKSPNPPTTSKINPLTEAAVPRATDNTKANSIQADTSSMAAQAIEKLPRGVVVKPRSNRIRANTGNAVTLIALARNSANTRKLVPPEEKRRYRKSAAAPPPNIGSAMLARLVTIVW